MESSRLTSNMQSPDAPENPAPNEEVKGDVPNVTQSDRMRHVFLSFLSS